MKISTMFCQIKLSGWKRFPCSACLPPHWVWMSGRRVCQQMKTVPSAPPGPYMPFPLRENECGPQNHQSMKHVWPPNHPVCPVIKSDHPLWTRLFLPQAELSAGRTVKCSVVSQHWTQSPVQSKYARHVYGMNDLLKVNHCDHHSRGWGC